MSADHRIEFDEATHTYRLAGRVVPSVTQILGPLYSFAGIDPLVLEAKRSLGIRVHKACEALDLGVLDERSLEPDVLGYLEAYKTFLDLKSPTLIACEQAVANPAEGYAGTLDRIYAVGGRVFVTDLKATAAISPITALQTEGYRRCVDAAGEYGRAVLQLKPDGKPVWREFNDPSDSAVWRSVLNVHHWRSKHGLI